MAISSRQVFNFFLLTNWHSDINTCSASLLQVGERGSSAWDRNLYFWSLDSYSVSYCVELSQEGHYFTSCCLYHFECFDGYCKGKGLLKCGLSLIMVCRMKRLLLLSAMLQKLSTETAGDHLVLFLTSCQFPNCFQHVR
jgi:hypothetical protein